MGANNSKLQYSVQVTDPKEGETGIYRRPDFEDGLITTPGHGITTMQELYLHNMKENADEEFLGTRNLPDGSLTEKYTWETYGEVEEISRYIGSGIINLNLFEEKAQFRDYKLKFISIYSRNTREWFLVDIANILYGITTMPLYDTLGEEATDHMFNETELSTVFLTCNHVKGITQRIKGGQVLHLKNIVIMDSFNINDEIKGYLEGVNHYTLEQVIEAGKENVQEYPKVTPEDIVFFSYTSGTTGKPKGAMVSNKNLIAAIAGAEAVLPLKHGWKHLSYLPLAHVLERIVTSVVIHIHGKIGIYGGDPRNIKHDLAALKPDFFVSVPRLYNKFYSAIMDKIKAQTGVKGYLAQKALASKEYYHEHGGYYQHTVWDKLVFGKMKEVLGGNCKYMLTGSAPISTEVRRFMKLAFCCPFAEGYGQTECLGGQFVTDPEDATMGHVGGPIPHVEFKLIDVPEMNYFSTDKDEEGRPAPRGEILCRSSSVIPGYYKNEEKTSEAIDEDGWLHSGDIGMILPENGALKIIDRRKNIFKLSIGEYIAPDKLQEVYKTVHGVEDIFVYGDSLKSVLIGIVCPNKDHIMEIAEANGIEGTYESLLENDRINKLIVDALAAKQKEADLKGFERISRIAFTKKTFEELDLLTTTFKIKRHEAKEAFQETLDTLYEGLD